MVHGELWEVLAEDVETKGAKILKNHKVTSINVSDNKIVSVECEVNGKEENKKCI